MNRFLQSILLLLATAVCALAATPADTPAPRISLLTADPGPEVYELYGHQAVRVVAPDGSDITYNYGLFDFDAPNFVYRFVKGETDYMGGALPTFQFLQGYASRGSRVREQVLNLTPAEALRMDSLLRVSVLPENATYRYRYCTDNCATRVVDVLEKSLDSQPQYPDMESGPVTWRSAMRRYDSHYPWYALSTDLALGREADRPITPRQRMFLPTELRRTVAATRLADGRPLVSAENTLVEGNGDATLPPTPFLLTPAFWGWLLLLLSLLAVYRAIRRGWGLMRWWASLWFALTGIAGALSWFLIFVSVHEATSPNILGWWLNPLWFVAACLMWMPGRRCRRLTHCLLTALSVAAGGMLIAWNFGAQSPDPALMLFCATGLLLSISYALTGASSHRHHHHRHLNGSKSRS